ncbi:MAG: phospholipase D-like domain-containing protein, partial [Flavobacteriales bacterium]
NPDTNIIMHHKHLVVDHNQPGNDPLLWVGSHNWSSNANTRNDENSLVIHDANIANQYYQEFVALINFQPIAGCTDPSACNYNSTATIDDASCLFLATPCDDGDQNTINDVVNFSCQCAGTLMVMGCTDITACNFSPQANVNDNSCLYTGNSCDDGNAETINDVINADCDCAGIINRVDELEEAAALVCYPNPTSERLNIQFTSALGGIATLVISDITGKNCFSHSISFSSGQNVRAIPVDALPAGTYFVSMLLDEGSVQTVFVKK